MYLGSPVPVSVGGEWATLIREKDREWEETDVAMKEHD